MVDKYESGGLAHCPKIGASFRELGELSASELRVWQNDYLREELAREKQALIDSSYPVLKLREPTREPYNPSPIKLNSLMSIIDEANKRKLPETPKAEPVKITPLFDILDARKKASKRARKKK